MEMPQERPTAAITTAELLAIGAELVAGETRDTNSGDLAAELTALGVEVLRMTQLPDELPVITAALRDALGRSDLVVTSGGLGPTPDDLTREGIAAALGEQPAVDPDLELWLRGLWERRDLPFSEVNLKQAWLIPSATALDNPHGTAPGWWIEKDDRVVVALPGPPRELAPMWRDHVLPRLRARGIGLDRAATTLHLTGIGESSVVDVVGADLLAAANPRMATYARPDYVDLRVSAVGDGTTSAREMVAAAVASLSPRLDPYALGRDGEDWPVALGTRLAGRTLAVVDAGTGGYLGMLLGTAPYLERAEQLRDRGVGAAGLATGVRDRAGADVGLAAVVGESGEDMRVEIGIDLEGETSCVTRTAFRGGDTGRRRCANAAITELWRRLGEPGT
jgi:nicotinamide-nucleotide amidase